MDLGLSSKCVVVTGGTRGIGFAIAEGCAREGAAISVCGRGVDSLQNAKQQLEEHGGKVHAAICDVGQPGAVAKYIDEAAEHLNGLHVLVNNPSGFGMEDNEHDWSAGIGVDLMGVVRGTWAAHEQMKSAGGGVILNISSISGIGPSSSISYGAVKAAVIQLTQSHAKAYADDRIRVNCIAPGSIEFPGGVWDRAKNNDPDFYNQVVASIPFGRMGTPEELANAALFLISDAASWITGQTLVVDGGQLL